MTSEPLQVSSTADLISVVPYLLGFHPADSVVVIALRGHRIVFCARHDLPSPGEAEAQAAHLATVVARQDVRTAMVLGYGERARVTPAVTGVATAVDGAGVRVIERLRVFHGRWWSYTCTNLSCCPAEGNPCVSAFPAAATYAGHVALPDRDALHARLAPVTGPDRERMTAATARAQERMTRLLSHDPVAAVLRAGRTAVRAAERAQRRDERLDDDEVAWLGMLLAREPVLRYAWSRGRGERWRQALFADVVRRVDPAYAAGPACLVGYDAWLAGSGALALAAVERALTEDAACEMARLLGDVLAHGLTPAMVADRLHRPGRSRRPRTPRARPA